MKKPSTAQAIQEVVDELRAIKRVLIGDPEFQSKGLVQDQRETAQILASCVTRLQGLETFRAEQEEKNKAFEAQPKKVIGQLRKYAAIVAFTITTIAGAIGWFQNTNFIHRMFGSLSDETHSSTTTTTTTNPAPR